MKISVVAHPNSKKTLPAGRQARIEKDLLGNFHVYVNQPPIEEKANKAIIEALIKYFKIRKNVIRLISGEKSKNKILKLPRYKSFSLF
ncbi:MAG: DUF167 domain-containing protein [Candidatus Pacearchaeota archaeon]